MHTAQSPDVVCFGMITPARVLVVDRLPPWNTGAVWTQGAEFVSDDAAIVATLLARWGVNTGLIGTALGGDEAGHRTVRMLRDAGVQGQFTLRAEIETPFEVNISDSRGGRTYIWNRRPEVVSTLDEADISSIGNASLLYVDWYDAPHIERAMDEARRHGVPVMLNIEHGHGEHGMLESLARRADTCQAVTDAAQVGTDAESIASLLEARGVSTVLVTQAAGGVVGKRGDELIHVAAPGLRAVDTCGAGATFSAAYIRCSLTGADFEESLRFAVAAASLKCTVVGPTAFPEDRIREVAGTLEVRRLG